MAERLRTTSSPRFHGLLITKLAFTDVNLGRGSDAAVFEVDWNGTVCAAKRLHNILLEDQSPGGADKLISNFEAECLTWSRLRHPGVVQFLGVHLEHNSRLPILIMEKMDTSLSAHLEGHNRRKEEFPLHLKAFVLRQVTQALAYLHDQNPPLVHHDLSPNNVLLNEVSLVTKVSDFGMSRAINLSALTRKSSIKGTLAFMAPEALHDPPRYNEKLDVFSFGNIIISTLTHEWPTAGAPTRYEGDVFVAITELQRRERYIEMFTAQEKQLFLPIVCQCLENRPDKRPSSVMLVQELRRIESSFATGSHVATPIKQLYQQLSAKEEECRQKDEALRENDVALADRDAVIRSKLDVIKGKDEALQHLDRIINEKDEVIRGKDVALREALKEKEKLKVENDLSLSVEVEVSNEKKTMIQCLSNEGGRTDSGKGKQLAAVQVVKGPLRDWRTLGQCRKVIQHRSVGNCYQAIAVNSEGLLVITSWRNGCVHLLTREGEWVRSIGQRLLGDFLFGAALDLKGNVWVSDHANHRVVKLSQDDCLLQTVHCASDESDGFSNPCGVSVSPEGLVYICDSNKHRVSVHDGEGVFLFAFGSDGSYPRGFKKPRDITFGPDNLVYVTDVGSETVHVWSKEGNFKRNFKPKYAPFYIAATSDNHLLVTSSSSYTVMVYTLEGKLVHEFGGSGSQTGRFKGPFGICVDDSGLVYVVDYENQRVQVF